MSEKKINNSKPVAAAASARPQPAKKAPAKAPAPRPAKSAAKPAPAKAPAAKPVAKPHGPAAVKAPAAKKQAEPKAAAAEKKHEAKAAPKPDPKAKPNAKPSAKAPAPKPADKPPAKQAKAKAEAKPQPAKPEAKAKSGPAAPKAAPAPKAAKSAPKPEPKPGKPAKPEKSAALKTEKPAKAEKPPKPAKPPKPPKPEKPPKLAPVAAALAKPMPAKPLAVAAGRAQPVTRTPTPQMRQVARPLAAPKPVVEQEQVGESHAVPAFKGRTTGAKGMVLVGAVGGAFGVKGEVRLRAFTDKPEGVISYGPLYGEDGKILLKPKSWRGMRDGVAVVAPEVKTREDAEKLKGQRLFVPRANLPPTAEDEFYIVDLLGCRAEALDGAVLGEIVAVWNFGAGDIIEYRPPNGGPNVRITFTKQTAPLVDLPGKRVVLDPPAPEPVGK